MNPSSRVLPNAFLNGSIIPVEQAHIPVLDRGFLFGDAIYEVIPVYSGQLFRAASHIERLMNGLAAISINCQQTESDWRQIFEQIVVANGGGDMSIYLQVTRGAGEFRDHAFPAGAEPLIFGLAQKLRPRAESIETEGVKAVLLEDTRWARCNIKSTSLLANILLRQEAVEQQAVEAILHKDGVVTEGAASTVMLAKNNVLVCPPDTNQILPGTTRKLVLELADQCDVSCRIESFTVDELLAADEVMISAATKDLMPVCRIGESPIGDGTPGPIWSTLDKAFGNYKMNTRSSVETTGTSS